MSLENSPILKTTQTGKVQSLNPRNVQKNVQQSFFQSANEAETRQQNQQSLRNLEKTGTTSPALEARVRKEQNAEVRKRLNSRSSIENESTRLQRASIDQVIPKNKVQQADIERHRTKMQRKCKHVFNVVTKQCELCGKSRISHI